MVNSQSLTHAAQCNTSLYSTKTSVTHTFLRQRPAEYCLDSIDATIRLTMQQTLSSSNKHRHQSWRCIATNWTYRSALPDLRSSLHCFKHMCGCFAGRTNISTYQEFKSFGWNATNMPTVYCNVITRKFHCNGLSNFELGVRSLHNFTHSKIRTVLGVTRYSSFWNMQI